MKIGEKEIVLGGRTFVIAEIGINHNGDLEIAKKLIDVAKEAGCDAVKFQKRTIDVVYTKEELAQPRESPWGTTNGDQKRGLEFGEKEYKEIDRYCREKDIMWSASCWDIESVDFINRFSPSFFKISSASLTHDELLERHLEIDLPIILSTGMSTLEEVDHAMDLFVPSDPISGEKEKVDYLALMHTVSTYPAEDQNLNLKVVETLQNRYHLPVGYSGHERGLATTIAAVALGACIVERHITLDRTMYGSDQAASLEPSGLKRLVRDIRVVEQALGDSRKRVLPEEIPIMRKLRRVYSSVSVLD